MGRSGRKPQGGHKDQYGSSMVSQDKEHFHGGSGRGGGTSGGGAGGSKRGADLTVTRQVPKFLQAHAHLLNKPQMDDDDESLTRAAALESDKQDNDDDFDKKDKEEALYQALQADPSLIHQHPELRQVANKMKATELKTRGNSAFGAGNHTEAVDIFTQCIDLDPSNEVFWSNRAAAYIALKQFDKAVADSREVVALRPDWVKGYARLGTALLGQEDLECLEVLQKAVALEPNDASIRALLDKAVKLEAKQVDAKQHMFKRKEREAMASGRRGGGDGGDEREKEKKNSIQQQKGVQVAETLGKKKKQLLSFDDADDDF